MYGTDPSEPGAYAAGLFAHEQIRDLLELGAGQGRDTLAFLRAGLTVTALDYAASALNRLQQAATDAGLADRLTTVAHDVRQPLPLPGSGFDAVYSHMLFNMALTTTELETLSSEVHRVLRPAGLHVYTVRHTGDAHYGAGTSHGDSMFENGGFIVHFFDRALVDRLVTGFTLLDLSAFEEGSLPRQLWRITQRREDAPLRPKELRPAAAQERSSERHGLVDELPVITRVRARPRPDQPEPGFRCHRGRLTIVPLRLDRRLMGGPGPMPAPSGHEQGSRLHMRDEHGGPGDQHQDEDADEDAEDRTAAATVVETVQEYQQEPQEDGPADDGGDRHPPPLPAGQHGQPGYRHPDRRSRQREENGPRPAELDGVEHGQPGAQHGQEQQSHPEMDRVATPGIEPVPQFVVGEPGGLGFGEKPTDKSRGANRQRLTVAGLTLEAGCLRMTGQELTDDLGRHVTCHR